MSASEGSRNWTMSSTTYADDTLSHPLKYTPSATYAAGTTPTYQGEYSNQHSTPYRWTPCPEWEQTGRCKYNETCYRRHGPEDQRIVPQGWEKKRSNRSSSTSSHGSSHSSGATSTGAYSNGGGSIVGNQHSSHSSSAQGQQGQWVPRQGSTAPRPAAPNPTKYPVGTTGAAIYAQQHPIHHGQHGGQMGVAPGASSSQFQTVPSHHTSGSSFNIDSATLSLSRVSVGSPEGYDSDPTTSPPILSPGVLSPTITSPTLSHRMSLSSSPRDSYDSHPPPVVEKPWIWQPCRHWQDSGSCRYGDSCKYRHGPEDRRERPAPRPTAHASAHLMRSNSNSSMESLGTFSTADSLVTGSRPNISLQPIGAQITSPNASMGTLPPFNNGLSSSHHSLPGSGNPIWDLFSPAVGRLSPPLGEDSAVIMQAFSEHLRNMSIHHPDSADLQSELNSIHIQSMIAIQLQRENFLPQSIQDSMRVLLQSVAISSNPHEWQFALIKVLDFLNALLDHLFNKFVSVSISSPSSSFGTLPVDIPSKLSLVQPYIGGRLSGSISELYDLGTRAAAGLFAPSQEEVITILEQLRRVAASTSKSV